MMRTPRRFTALLLAGLLATGAAVDAVGVLSIAVTDPSGQPLAGVHVLVRGPAHAERRWSGITDQAGALLLKDLPAGGGYKVEASLQGHATTIVSQLEVHAAQTERVNIRLAGQEELRERVRVQAVAPVVALDEQGTATRFSSEYLDALPILGRNYQDVLTLSPGVTDVDGDGNPNIHGARDTDVGTLVDGVNTTDPLTGKIGMQLNIESIQEIEVKTSGANAEFGRAQGGFANVLTKSGGNQFEGTFKFYWRGSRLDGDGAGQDSPLLHGGVGQATLAQLSFNDYLPFLSISGPLVRDRAWFFASAEFIRRQDPVNALNQAFVTTTRENRVFLKGTWQVSTNHRLALVFNSDPVEMLNQGLSSLTREESGYTVRSGGPMVTLRDTSVLGPTVALDTVASYLETRPGLTPNLGPDTNGDGFLYADRNANGFFEARERDPGEDYDGDGAFDVWEDTLVPNSMLDEKEQIWCHDKFGAFGPQLGSAACVDQPHSYLVNEDGFRDPPGTPPFNWHPPGDGDRRLTEPGGCEGAQREDIDCDGHLDKVNEDVNHNGRLDPGEDLDGDGYLDLGNEDRNNNGKIDDTPFPTSLYPYGHLSPTPADRNYTIDLRSGLVSGPYFEEYQDGRSRAALRQDLSVFVPEFHGSHDLRFGYMLERERYQRTASELPVIAVNDPGYHTGTIIDQVQHPEIHFDCDPYLQECHDPGVGRVTAILPVATTTQEGAGGLSLGTYVQDTFKPTPNVSIGLGLRFDRETIDSSGFTYFDPMQEAFKSGRMRALAGGEAGQDDLVVGNGDGIQSLGIRTDPLNTGSALWKSMVDDLTHASVRVLMHPATELASASPALMALYPDLFKNGQIDPGVVKALGIPIQQPESFTIDNSNLSPRLSASWDPMANGRTKLFSTWGRYYDRLFLSTVTGEQGLQSVQRYYVLDRYGVSANQGSSSASAGNASPDHGFGTLLSSAPPTVTQVTRNLKTPFCDELTLGFEREVAPEVALSVRYIRRQYRDQLQDIDVNHEVRIDPVTGRMADRLGLLLVSQPDPAAPPVVLRTPDGRPDLFVRNFFFNQVLRVGNFNTAFYHGIELEVRHRLARHWQLEGSYTYSRAMGQAEDFQSRLGNDPSAVESEFGYLDYDQRHVVKVNASFYLPRDWQMGMASVWASGLPFSVESRFFAHDNVDYQQFRTRYGFTVTGAGEPVFIDLPRNSGRNNATLNIDLSVRRHFVVGKTVWAGMFDVFNLLNSDDLWIRSVEPSRAQALGTGGVAVPASPTELDATRRFGRRFQIGFQVQF